MRGYITAHDIANEIRMTRSQFKGSFLLVEGAASDLKIYRRFIEREFCQIIPAHGKENAMQALEILENETFPGVLAIVDADFWRLESFEIPSPHLFVTDTHDLETMLLNSPALEKLLDEFGSPNKIKKLIRQEKGDIRQRLLKIGQPIGYLRWVSQRDGYALTFDGINYSRFIDKKKLRLNILKMIRAVKNKSKRHDLDENQLQKLIVEATDEEHNLWDVCSGHDLVCILSIALCRVIGSNQSNEVKPELLEKFLRAGYETVYFYATELYQALRIWEANNPHFQIFPLEKIS